MKRLGLTAIALAVFAASNQQTPAEDAQGAAKWVFRELKSNRRIAHVEMRGTGAGGPVEAMLVISRDGGEAGLKPVTKAGATTPPVIIELCLQRAKQAAPFPLDDFEGPDAPANRSKLVKIMVAADGKPWSASWVTSGWYSNASTVLNPFETTAAEKKSAEPLAFVFGLGDPVRDYKELLEFVSRLGRAEQPASIQITSTRDRNNHLEFKVPISGASDAVKKLMAPK